MEKILPQESTLSVVRFIGGLQIIGYTLWRTENISLGAGEKRLYIEKALEIMVAQVPMQSPTGIQVQNVVQLVPISAAAAAKGENIGPFHAKDVLLCKAMPREAQLSQQYMNATTGLIIAPGMPPGR
jgi:hypothetical protein